VGDIARMTIADYKNRIVVKYSGGMGSFLASFLLREKFPDKEIIFYFSDTLMESDGLYKFLFDTILHFHSDTICSEQLVSMSENIPAINFPDQRRNHLLEYGRIMNNTFPQFIYDADGRNIWEIFNDVKFMGNTRIDPCSRLLKRERGNKYITEHFSPLDTSIAVGIDWTEEHRYIRAVPLSLPFQLIAPLVDFSIDKVSYGKKVLQQTGIQESSAYLAGFDHDNCGGFCVKAGLGHFSKLLQLDREKYLWHEKQQEKLFRKIGQHPFLRKVINNKQYYISLREYRFYIENGELTVNGQTVINETNQLTLFQRITEDELDIGGCGCGI
jgi:hypothetical protein